MTPEPTDPTAEKALLRELGEHIRDHDPDLEHVPDFLIQREGELLRIEECADETGEPDRLDGVLVISPRLFGHAHRLTNQETDLDA